MLCVPEECLYERDEVQLGGERTHGGRGKKYGLSVLVVEFRATPYARDASDRNPHACLVRDRSAVLNVHVHNARGSARIVKNCKYFTTPLMRKLWNRRRKGSQMETQRACLIHRRTSSSRFGSSPSVASYGRYCRTEWRPTGSIPAPQVAAANGYLRTPNSGSWRMTRPGCVVL